MALRDKGLYTLRLLPAAQNPTVLEVVEGGSIPGAGPSSTGGGDARFARVREGREGEVYSSVLYGECGLRRAACGGIPSPSERVHGADAGAIDRTAHTHTQTHTAAQSSPRQASCLTSSSRAGLSYTGRTRTSRLRTGERCKLGAGVRAMAAADTCSSSVVS